MKELIEFIARSLVDAPGEVVVTESRRDASTTLLELRVAPDEVGKLIGRQGRTARSIRNLLAVAAAKEHHRYVLEILD